ncbi:MAG: SWIM zinc finger family protein, partial [Planctomycetes bacterium]|nr:SWIM zinc finger family protein [Planctomycetota bacterium]
MSLASCCTHSFEPRTRSRGQSYFYGQSVEITAYLDGCVEAYVEGSRRSPYEVVLDWSRADRRMLEASCTCPHYEDGFLCKHIWATILAVDASHLVDDVPESYRLDVVHDDEIDDDDLYDSSHATGLSNLSPYRNESGFGGNGPFRRQTSAHWKRQLPTAHPREQQLVAAAIGNWPGRAQTESEAWYVLNVGTSLERGSLVIDFHQRQRKKDGKFGKIKRLSVRRKEQPEISNTEDVEFLQLLLGNQAQNDSQYHSYYYSGSYHDSQTYTRSVVAPAMYGVLLPRLCETGRFVWLLNGSLPVEDGRVLAWDDGPAWAFRLRVTSDDAAQAWAIEGELFRADESVPLQDAVLLLAHGLVLFPDRLARLDASDAFAWAAALRKASPIQVPFAD